MDHKEAVALIENHIQVHGIGQGVYMKLAEALAYSIAAIKELEERNKGCKFCEAYKTYNTTETTLIIKNLLHGERWYDVKMDYCPKCGKSLKGR